MLLIANAPRSGTPRSSLHPAGLGAIYRGGVGQRGREKKMQSKPAGVPESRERGFAQHSGDEEQSQAAARASDIAGGRSPSSLGHGCAKAHWDAAALLMLEVFQIHSAKLFPPQSCALRAGSDAHSYGALRDAERRRKQRRATKGWYEGYCPPRPRPPDLVGVMLWVLTV